MKSEMTNLDQQIFLLEQRQTKVLLQMKQQGNFILESMKPINIAKRIGDNVLQKIKIESKTINKLISNGIDEIGSTINKKVSLSPITIFLKTLYSLRK